MDSARLNEASAANIVSTNEWGLHRVQQMESASPLTTADADRKALQYNTATDKFPIGILQSALERLV